MKGCAKQLADECELDWVGYAVAAFPSSHGGKWHSQHSGQFAGRNAALHAFDLDFVTKRFHGCRERLSRLTIRRNVAARCANRSMCKTQQLYPPVGEREANATALFLLFKRAGYV